MSGVCENNNPGNILNVGQALAIGTYQTNNLNYCIFPDYATGVEAAVQMLEGPLYAGAGLSVDAVMARWIGPDATAGALKHYQEGVDHALRLPGSTLVSTLTEGQLETVLTRGIQVEESWHPGAVKVNPI
jgi:hypothetical protein